MKRPPRGPDRAPPHELGEPVTFAATSTESAPAPDADCRQHRPMGQATCEFVRRRAEIVARHDVGFLPKMSSARWRTYSSTLDSFAFSTFACWVSSDKGAPFSSFVAGGGVKGGRSNIWFR